MSEIDDIFGSSSSSSNNRSSAKVAGPKGAKALSGTAHVAPRGKRKRNAEAQLPNPPPAAATSSTAASSSSSSPATSVAAGKGSKDASPASRSVPTAKKARPAAPTFFDPSAEIERDGRVAAQEAKGGGKGKSVSKGGEKGPTTQRKDLGSFIDSRGTGRSRTEEGFAIYSEKELNLGKGGDTPLCPFDCDCCF